MQVAGHCSIKLANSNPDRRFERVVHGAGRDAVCFFQGRPGEDFRCVTDLYPEDESGAGPHGARLRFGP